jgi:hypothetical protein
MMLLAGLLGVVIVAAGFREAARKRFQGTAIKVLPP